MEWTFYIFPQFFWKLAVCVNKSFIKEYPYIITQNNLLFKSQKIDIYDLLKLTILTPP